MKEKQEDQSKTAGDFYIYILINIFDTYIIFLNLLFLCRENLVRFVLEFLERRIFE